MCLSQASLSRLLSSPCHRFPMQTSPVVADTPSPASTTTGQPLDPLDEKRPAVSPATSSGPILRKGTTATQRLKQDYLRIVKDPVPYVTAHPLPSNILEW